LSALGMLMADETRDYAAGVLGRRDTAVRFESLERTARRESPNTKIERTADLRYRGQSYELNVPFSSKTSAMKLFHAEHAKVYGYALPAHEVEIVTIRVRARRAVPKPKLARGRAVKGAPEMRRVWVGGSWRKMPVWQREGLGQATHGGPALVLDYGST